ncbi:MAG: deoxyguanosinetriphosphate triphosphohydrolase [Gemmataceae bacterium]|nr:deoxyguanosinetriphosphate triphosphohydrolase [Gemmataceae bacterium]
MSADNLFQPPDALEREDATLAPYAMRTRDSRGRRHPEAPHPYRGLYQRDRDRIVHSTAFRRLMHKTQVLVSQTNDHHRTRLTHTLEVTQISRTIARQLGLNEDLTEAIALLHDLGHPAFGHAGEEALDECMAGHQGFEHNRHALRIVQTLEYRYAGFPGLNLSWEVLEAQAMHSKRRDDPEIKVFLTPPSPPSQGGAPGGWQPLLEAQIVDAADSLAYNAHDVDDALSVGLIPIADLDAVPFWKEAVERSRAKYPNLGPRQFQATIIRALIDWQVTDLLEHTRRNLREHRVGAVAHVRRCPQGLVGLSPEVVRLKAGLEDFLRERVYRHYRVMRMAAKGRRILHALFHEFLRLPDQLPERYRELLTVEAPQRIVCDYLAGMTDRFAQDEFLRLFQPYTLV